jgi:predicted TIM-barrel fold metal-dependent hydrolase
VVIDTHVHVVSGDHARYPLQPSTFTGPWYETHPHSAEQLRVLMADAGVDGAVLVQGVSAYGYDNRYTLDAAAAHADVFTTVVCSARSGPDAVGEVTQLVRDEGARGYRWFTFHGEADISEPRALWDALADLGVPVVVTLLADRLPEFIELVPTLAPVPIAVDHCAFADLTHGVPDDLAALAQFANVHLKVSTHAIRSAARGGDPADTIAELAARFGGRLMWGSDFSQTHDVPYADLVEEGRRAGSKLPDAHRDAYFANTALTLWPELRR